MYDREMHSHVYPGIDRTFEKGGGSFSLQGERCILDDSDFHIRSGHAVFILPLQLCYAVCILPDIVHIEFAPDYREQQLACARVCSRQDIYFGREGHRGVDLF